MGNKTSSQYYRTMTTNYTLEYYNQNAESFISGSVNIDMSDIQSRFLDYLPQHGTILDLGCGSGRDSKVFIEKGYDVTAVDGSAKMCELTSAYLNHPVIHATFQSFQPEQQFDGIWASASLLHLSKEELPAVLRKYAGFLKKDGCFYASFKYGTFIGDRTGRYYTDMDEAAFNELLAQVPELVIKEELITADSLPEREGLRWLNVFMGVKDEPVWK